MSLLHFEDFKVGAVECYGSQTISRDEIITFARQFDPQPMHLDEAAAAKSMLGGLAASGWHVCALLAVMVTEGFVKNSTGMGSPGVDEVKWLLPVRPGDTLSLRHTVMEATPSRSKPDRGFVKFRYEMLNQREEVVLEQTGGIIFRRRNPGAAA